MGIDLSRGTTVIRTHPAHKNLYNLVFSLGIGIFGPDYYSMFYRSREAERFALKQAKEGVSHLGASGRGEAYYHSNMTPYVAPEDKTNWCGL